MQPAGRITLNTTETAYIVELKDILYCKCDNSYTTFFIANHDPVVISQGINKVEQNLGTTNFIRPHQTYLVNINHIKEIRKANSFSLILSDNSAIPISTRKRKEVMQRLLNSKGLRSINK